MKTFWLLYKSRQSYPFERCLLLFLGCASSRNRVMGFYGGQSGIFNSDFASVSTVGICAAGVMGLPLALSSYRERKF